MAITPLKHDPSLVMVSSVDFFSPISLDPYKQGYITAANALSDLYAVGVTEIDSMLMILGQSTKMEPAHRIIISTLIMRGFIQCCTDAGVACLGGQTVLNPWPLIGGSCSAVLPRQRILSPGKAEPGDVLILTKPLGTQVAGNLALWMLNQEKWSLVCGLFSEEEAANAVIASERWMMKLNREAASLAVELGAHGATDITGFGLVGHAENLVLVQDKSVDFVIDKLPIIKGLVKVEKGVTIDYRLSQGHSAETSGGLLIILSPSLVGGFMARYPDCWVVGKVIEGQRQAYISNTCALTEVD